MTFLKHLTYTSTIILLALSLSLAAKTEQVITFDDGKAHYILEVMKHITWPNEIEITHFNIAILGNDNNLFNALNNKLTQKIRNKSLSVKQFSSLNQAKGNFEVVVVSKKKLPFLNNISKRFPRALIVSNGTIDRESIMVALMAHRKTIKLSVNRENLIKHGFIISNNLLDFAGTKADLKGQLDEREIRLSQVLKEVGTQEEHLKKLNQSLTSSQHELSQIQSKLALQNKQLEITQVQVSSLQNSEKAIQTKLMIQQENLINQKKLIAAKQEDIRMQELALQQLQTKLIKLNENIGQAENKLKQQVTQLSQQSSIIELKEEKINDQRQLLIITIAGVFILLLIKFMVIRISNVRKQANDELAHLNEQLYELATTDDMTKLFNRRHFLELAQRELNQLHRANNMAVILMIDIDHFKNVNDNHGHAAGDEAITNIANILTGDLRDYDIVGRVGGEEFAMFLPNSNVEIAHQIAERVRLKVAESTTLYQQTSIKLTVSIGLTARLEDENDIGNMINRADKALYKAKNSGRNSVAFF